MICSYLYDDMLIFIYLGGERGEMASSLLSGMLGGYLGSLLADPEGVRNVRLVASSLTSPDVAPFVYMGTIISTTFTSAWYGYRLWLYNED